MSRRAQQQGEDESMQYVSTRGDTPAMGFQDAVLTGLAPDGGLLIPERVPDVRDRLDAWAQLSYQDLTFELLRLFVDLPDEDLRVLIDRSYASFRHPEIAPAVPVGDIQVLELFHGPTLAFKDVALQFLGNFFEYILERRDQRMNILAATSGDTGSAAIYGVRGRERINIFVMHPRGRVAPLQERQMTTVLDENVFNLAVDGTFDDCQRIMKGLFRDLPFKHQYTLGAVNSVNWARVLTQIVYYFSSGLYVMQQTGAAQVRFTVPTGNFGDILAGYYARQMGLPISKLILATNENDILSRFFATGSYKRGDVRPTISPSMDIQVASNFERYLFDRVDRDPHRLKQLLADFDQQGELRLPLDKQGRVDALFEAGVGSTADTLATIKRYYQQHGYLLDPHTAVGVFVGEQYRVDDEPLIALATAHPAKFSQAIMDATGEDLAHHPILDAILDAPTRCDEIDAEQDRIRAYIADHVPATV
jgi:threonine synthase